VSEGVPFFYREVPLFVRRAMSTNGMDRLLLPAAIVCISKEVSRIVGFSTDGRITFCRRIKRLAVASPLEYKANHCAISMGGPATDIERSDQLSPLGMERPRPLLAT
jgi:hypothetical protein